MHMIAILSFSLAFIPDYWQSIFLIFIASYGYADNIVDIGADRGILKSNTHSGLI